MLVVGVVRVCVEGVEVRGRGVLVLGVVRVCGCGVLGVVKGVW